MPNEPEPPKQHRGLLMIDEPMPMPMRSMNYRGHITAADRTPSGARAMIAAQLRAHADAIDAGDFAESGNGGPADMHAWNITDPWNGEAMPPDHPPRGQRYLLAEAIELLQITLNSPDEHTQQRAKEIAGRWMRGLGIDQQPPHVPCCPSCTHTAEEHSAFMRGWMFGTFNLGGDVEEARLEEEGTHLEHAFDAGYSAATLGPIPAGSPYFDHRR